MNGRVGWVACSVLAVALAGIAVPSHARSVEGYRVEETVRVGSTTLVLNGVGIRAVSIFKGYVAALYVQKRSANPEELLLEKGPKRIALRMLLAADAATFTRALTGGLERNSTPAELGALAAQREQFTDNLKLARAVKPGDLVDIEFLPGIGTRLFLNGKACGVTVGGDDFYVAFLKIFIGEHVQDLPMKAGLLGARGAS